MAIADAKTAFLAAAKRAAGLKTVLEHDPENISIGAHGLPAVTLYPLAPRIDDPDIRGIGDLVQPFRLSIYVSLSKTRKGSDFAPTQQQLEELARTILQVPLADPTLGGTCLWSEVAPESDQPVMDDVAGLGYSSLLLTITDVAAPV